MLIVSSWQMLKEKPSTSIAKFTQDFRIKGLKVLYINLFLFIYNRGCDHNVVI